MLTQNRMASQLSDCSHPYWARRRRTVRTTRVNDTAKQRFMPPTTLACCSAKLAEQPIICVIWPSKDALTLRNPPNVSQFYSARNRQNSLGGDLIIIPTSIVALDTTSTPRRSRDNETVFHSIGDYPVEIPASRRGFGSHRHYFPRRRASAARVSRVGWRRVLGVSARRNGFVDRMSYLRQKRARQMQLAGANEPTPQ
jgi:hypothetical protein